jgi:hypothetical protein
MANVHVHGAKAYLGCEQAQILWKPLAPEDLPQC